MPTLFSIGLKDKYVLREQSFIPKSVEMTALHVSKFFEIMGYLRWCS